MAGAGCRHGETRTGQGMRTVLLPANHLIATTCSMPLGHLLGVPTAGSLLPARRIAQLASFQGGVDGKTSPGAEATPLPPEQMRPPGPITLAGECTRCVALVAVWYALAVCVAGRPAGCTMWL